MPCHHLRPYSAWEQKVPNRELYFKVNASGITFLKGINSSCCINVFWCVVGTSQGMAVTSAGFHTEGGTGGIYPPHDFGKGGISPPSNCRTVFFLMGILVKSFKKVFRRQIPFFSKFVFSNCPPPINFFLAETLVSNWAIIKVKFNNSSQKQKN